MILICQACGQPAVRVTQEERILDLVDGSKVEASKVRIGWCQAHAPGAAAAIASVSAILRLRQRTGLNGMKCKRALEETGGDEEAAMRWLRQESQKRRPATGSDMV